MRLHHVGWTKSTIEARVARGALLLDELRPGWEKQINVERLDMRDNRCILGQLWGGDAEKAFFAIWSKPSYLFQGAVFFTLGRPGVAWYGFDAYRHWNAFTTAIEYKQLRAAWLMEISVRTVEFRIPDNVQDAKSWPILRSL